jgi:hypothetical protein
MGNQQEKEEVHDIEWAWLAGMMNGDGCFSLQLRKRENRWKCDVSITLTQTDPSIIERTISILNRGIGCNPSIQEYEPCGAGINNKFNLRVTKMSGIAAWIEKIEPYMCGNKLARARLMLRYVRNRMKYEGTSRKRNTIEKDPEALSLAAEYYRLTGVEVPGEISQNLRDYPQGVGPSGPKRTAPEGEDIVPSCAKVQVPTIKGFLESYMCG